MIKKIWSLLIVNITLSFFNVYAQFYMSWDSSFIDSSGCDTISCPSINVSQISYEDSLVPVLYSALKYYLYFWVVLCCIYIVILFIRDKFLKKPRRNSYISLWKKIIFIYVLIFVCAVLIFLYNFFL